MNYHRIGMYLASIPLELSLSDFVKLNFILIENMSN